MKENKDQKKMPEEEDRDSTFATEQGSEEKEAFMDDKLSNFSDSIVI